MEPGSYIIIAILFLLAVCGWLSYFISVRKVKAGEKKHKISLTELTQYRRNIHKYELENRDVYLNPHIFKNTLNAIRNYAFKTHLALDKLGGVLDYILYDSKVNFTSLREEIEFVKDFIELNKFRLNPLLDFRISIEIDESNPVYDKKIMLPLLTVDFIENAFKHGDLSGQSGFIKVSLKLNNGSFRYEVLNAVNLNPVVSASKGGLGQKKLKDRLDMVYSGNYKLEYVKDNNVYRALLKLDLYEIEHKMHTSG